MIFELDILTKTKLFSFLMISYVQRTKKNQDCKITLIKGVSFQRNCGAVSVGDYNRVV